MPKLFIILFFSLASWGQDNVETARELLERGKTPEAEQLLRALVNSDPGHASAHEMLGDICGRRKNWDCALEHYGALRKLWPNKAVSHYKYGGALGMKAKNSNKFRALGMIGDVRSSFERAIALDPKHLEARWALLELNLQLPAIAGGSTKKANQYASELAFLSPVDGCLAHGRIADHLGNVASAEKNYKLAWEKYNSKTGARKLAALYRRIDKPQKARAVLAAIGD